MNPRRCRVTTPKPEHPGPVLYWMHRNLRAADNWALIHAREQALARQAPVGVVFCLAPRFLDATMRHFDFLLRGLEETVALLAEANIACTILTGEPGLEVARFAQETGAGLVVTDFDPLRVKRAWLDQFQAASPVPMHEVDARNIVPCWIASDKREFMAKTIRPKIRRHLQEFLEPFPEFPPHPHAWPRTFDQPDFSRLRDALRVDTSVAPVGWLTPGEQGGRDLLDAFLATRLTRYNQRNDPNVDACSHLSGHLHFGMISAQRVALEVMRHPDKGEHVDAFIEELVIRRELSDNFCLHTPDYDSVSGFPVWAQETLRVHETDPRPVIHSLDEFETARTHDPLWNAAQRQLVRHGMMHGYLRMYWAKKILEWTENAAQALSVAIRLNDRHSLDGRDSNGYTGIAWSLGGVHDRGWTERPIFGKIRYMNYQGARRKFDVDAFVRSWSESSS